MRLDQAYYHVIAYSQEHSSLIPASKHPALRQLLAGDNPQNVIMEDNANMDIAHGSNSATSADGKPYGTSNTSYNDLNFSNCIWDNLTSSFEGGTRHARMTAAHYYGNPNEEYDQASNTD